MKKQIVILLLALITLGLLALSMLSTKSTLSANMPNTADYKFSAAIKLTRRWRDQRTPLIFHRPGL